MKLRFIGKDGSMRLKSGKVYDIEIRTIREFIVVFINDPELGHLKCPYTSIRTLGNNWKLP